MMSSLEFVDWTRARINERRNAQVCQRLRNPQRFNLLDNRKKKRDEVLVMSKTRRNAVIMVVGLVLFVVGFALFSVSQSVMSIELFAISWSLMLAGLGLLFGGLVTTVRDRHN